MSNKKYLTIILLLFVTILFSGCLKQNNAGTSEDDTRAKEDFSCTVDSDCQQLDCSEYKNQKPRLYPICEYNECVCGCGDPENGKKCR